MAASYLKTEKQVFDLYDQDSKGWLSKHELKCALIYLTGEKPSYSLVKRLTTTYGKQIGYENFRKIYSGLNASDADLATESFKAVDREAKGFLTF
jgi:Ca2+-binding EF-hand superfamily protein